MNCDKQVGTNLIEAKNNCTGIPQMDRQERTWHINKKKTHENKWLNKYKEYKIKAPIKNNIL